MRWRVADELRMDVDTMLLGAFNFDAVDYTAFCFRELLLIRTTLGVDTFFMLLRAATAG